MTRLTLATLMISALAACGSDPNNNNNGTCGDGHVDTGEQCDDGNVSNGDGCSSTCKTETTTHCGDGVIDVATEDCDDGNTVDGDGCSATCHGECGNGMLDTNEACDDGNKVSNDGCSAACAVETGFTCTGEPSHCTAPTGTCTAPFIVAMANNNGTLEGAGSGDTTNGTDQVPAADCDNFSGDIITSGGGHDNIWQFTIPDRRDVSIVIGTTTPFDATLRLFAAACDHATEVSEYLDHDGCSDNGVAGEGEELDFIALPAGTYFVVIDGFDATEMGTYDFTVTAAPSACGNGMLDGFETCDDTNTMTNDGCNDRCDTEHGYTCSGEPSVCVSACGNGQLDVGEECDDGHTVDGDRCSATCTLEYDVLEADSVANNTVPQVITASNHIIKGSLTAGDVDLYSFTLTAPATIELETYDSIDLTDDYLGVGNPLLDCNADDTQIRIFDSAGDVTMDTTAKWFDDDDGQHLCSYMGPNDADGVTTEGVLQPGTYTIKINDYSATGTDTRYLLDFKITTTGPVPPLAGDLVLNEYMAADNMSDTNCDGSITGTRDEFVELVNVSNKQLDLTGVTIADSVILRHTFAPAATGSMTLAPGKAVVVWGGGAPNCAGVTNWFLAKASPTSTNDQLGLNDAGDTITIKNAAGDVLVNRVYTSATVNLSDNLSPDVSGTTYAHHNMVNGAVGDFSPGKRANGTAF